MTFCCRDYNKAQVLRPAPFFFASRMAVLADYEQDHEQGGDQNDVSRSVHVVKNAVDFFHVGIS
jgi:hypothetical protein